jgi:hypothetical protein
MARSFKREKLEDTAKRHDAIMEELMSEIANGKDLSQLLLKDKDPRFPSYKAIRSWIAQSTKYQKMWATAKMAQAECEFEKTSEIYDQLMSRQLDPKAAKVGLDIIRWRASRLYPKKYNERLVLEASDDENAKGFKISIPQLERLKNKDTE